MKRFQNLHQGRRCFICGNGPSMKTIDLSLLGDELTFGCNGIFYSRLNLTPNYYACEAPSMSKEHPAEILAYTGPHWKFLSQRYRQWFEKAAQIVDGQDPLQHVIWTNYDYDNWEVPPPRFSRDTSEVVCNGYSVMYSMIQIAAYFGCDPIYLLGLDFDYKDGDAKPVHCYEKQHRAYDFTQKERQRLAFKHAAEVLPTRLFNATPGSQLYVVQPVPYQGLFD